MNFVDLGQSKYIAKVKVRVCPGFAFGPFTLRSRLLKARHYNVLLKVEEVEGELFKDLYKEDVGAILEYSGIYRFPECIHFLKILKQGIFFEEKLPSQVIFHKEIIQISSLGIQFKKKLVIYSGGI